MKLLWIIKNFPPSMGGVQQYVYHLVLNLPSYSCVVLTRKLEHENKKEIAEIDSLLSKKQQTIYRSLNIPDDLRLFSIFKHPLLFISFCRHVNKVIKKENISHVIFANPPFFYFISLVFLKVMVHLPFICVFHGEDIPTIKMKSNGLFRWLVNKLDVLVCNSLFTHNRLQNFLGRKVPCHIAYPGVEDSFFEYNDKETCKQKFGVNGKHVLYTVGRLDERKGHDLVIKSLPAIIEQVPEVVYLVGGEGPHLIELKSLVDDLHLHNYVKFCGFIVEKDIVAFHHAGDVFVMPNRILPDGDTEGFGIVFLEAAAAGKPVIGGRAGGAVDAVIDGKTGFLVDPYSPDEFVEKTVSLLSSQLQCDKMGKQGQKRAMECFRWPILADYLYKELPKWSR